MSSRPLLRAINGPLAGSSFPLTGQIVIGRAEDVDISVPDESVSRLHAVLTVAEDGSVSLTDVSSNGTFVAGKATKQGVLVPGCTVRIGKSQFVFERVEGQDAVRSDRAATTSRIADRDRPTQVDIDAIERKMRPQGHGLAYKTTQALSLDDLPDEWD